MEKIYVKQFEYNALDDGSKKGGQGCLFELDCNKFLEEKGISLDRVVSMSHSIRPTLMPPLKLEGDPVLINSDVYTIFYKEDILKKK